MRPSCDPDPARWRRLRELFTHLADKSPGQRARHLELVCDDDAALREEVEALLAEHDRLDATTGGPAAGVRPGDRSLPTAPATIGEYRLLEPLGHGGAGTVYRALHPMRGEVALKLQPAAAMAGTTARRRFEQEANALGALRHPVLVALHEMFVAAGHAVLVMELVRGRSLAEHLHERVFTWRESLAIVRALVDALAVAHAHGIVHRDIKPGNVMVDAQQRVRLIDFGIAKFFDARLTLTGQRLGSPRYMSPEQWLGAPLDAHSDQFSLGLLWYELLAGHLPFDELSGGRPRKTHDLRILAQRALGATPAPLPAFSIDGVALGPAECVLQRMLAKRPDARFRDLHDLSVALGELTHV